ncbi:hypothetical protein [Jatrophihabitans sp.]|uniref:hypothetical protein n=1 Tax=Jatrophihabitans sp. TaxID=1932789 RepID=UPI0030C754D2
MVFFTSTGARDVYKQMDATTAAKQATETDPTLRRLDELEADVPDVVGPDWIVWGNDPTASAAAINALHGVVSPAESPTPTPTMPSSSSAQPNPAPPSNSTASVPASTSLTATPGPKTRTVVALQCKVESFGADGSEFEVENDAAYAGKAQVTLYESSAGITFPVKPIVTVAPAGSSANWHSVPGDDMGASAEPDTCTAHAISTH